MCFFFQLSIVNKLTLLYDPKVDDFGTASVIGSASSGSSSSLSFLLVRFK